MANVNEQIIEQYLKLRKKWFYISDVSFKVPHNCSNIDILAFNPFENKYYDIEIKYRSRFVIAANSKKGKDISSRNIMMFTKQFTNYPEREKKLRNM